MKVSEYTNIRLLEDVHWWYAATHRLVFRDLRRLGIRSSVLDAGCGTGGLLERMRGSFRVTGFDGSFEAAGKASQRTGVEGSVALGDVECIPFQDNRFDAVTCIDVIYHAKVGDEKRALEEICRVLKPGGHLLLQVPAFECLRGGHDEAVHTRKRYRAPEIRSLLRQAGFRRVKVRYRYPWLFVPALLIRNLTRGSGKSDLRPMGGILNTFLLHFSRFFDSSLFASVPFGTSVFAVAEKTA